MFNFLKRRAASTGTVTGSRAKFAVAPPAGDDAAAQVVPVGYYRFHRGDTFNQGTNNWALDPMYDTPLGTLWGNGILVRNVHAFRPVQPTPVYTQPAAPITALRGIFVDGVSLQTLHALPGQPKADRFNG